MKTITLHIDDEVFNDLESSIRTKRLAGTYGGVNDMVNLAVLEAIKANQSERTLRYRKREKVINVVGK